MAIRRGANGQASYLELHLGALLFVTEYAVTDQKKRNYFIIKVLGISHF